MSTVPYSVSVVLDRSFGSRLSDLLATGPVWIVDSPVNRAVAENLWAQSPSRSHLEGATTFKAAEADSPEEMLIGNLGTIDLHHGFYSADPPYTVLEMQGDHPSAPGHHPDPHDCRTSHRTLQRGRKAPYAAEQKPDRGRGKDVGRKSQKADFPAPLAIPQ